MTLQCSYSSPSGQGIFQAGRLQKPVFFHRKALSVSLGFDFKLLQWGTQIHLVSVLTQQGKGTEGYAPKGICLFAGTYQEMHISTCRQTHGCIEKMPACWISLVELLSLGKNDS